MLYEVITKNIRTVDLSGQNFVVVSVREHGSDGRFYAVDKDGTVWLSGPVTSGAEEHRSPSGIFTIFQKKRYHMSTRYPVITSYSIHYTKLYEYLFLLLKKTLN